MSSGGGHTYTYTPDTTSSDAVAAAAKAKWATYQEKYLPIIQKLSGEIGTHQDEINQAGATSDIAQDNTSEAMDRKIQQYGTQLSPLQQSAMVSKATSNKALAGVTAKNTERRGIAARNEYLTGELTNLGTNLENSSTTALNNAAGLEATRNATGYSTAANKTANSYANASNRWGLAGSAVGTGLTAAAIFS